MSGVLKALVEVLDLEQLEVNLYRGQSLDPDRRRVFGGLVLGQALVAATRTVEDRFTHSLHGYFLRAGDPQCPILYEVDRIRDGKSFNTRRVVAIQKGRAIFNMSVSFHKHEQGYDHQFDMPDLPGPEELEPESALREKLVSQIPERWRDRFLQEQPIEIRPINPIDNLLKPSPCPPYQHIWIKAIGPLPDNLTLHQCMLAYSSDFTLLATAMRPHGASFLDPTFQAASLDHAMWFHRPFRMDEWLLYTQDSPSAYSSRGFNRGLIYTQDGKLIASTTQEGLIRKMDGA